MIQNKVPEETKPNSTKFGLDTLVYCAFILVQAPSQASAQAPSQASAQAPSQGQASYQDLYPLPAQPEKIHGLMVKKKHSPAITLSKKRPTVASTTGLSQTQALSQAQGSSKSNDRPKGHGATRYEAGPSPARFDRPDPSKSTFDISKPVHLQAAVASLVDRQYQRKRQSRSQGVAGTSQSREKGSFQNSFGITGNPSTVF
ncbi:hypothetical protein [Parasitella parasitica]|uniref:Uncharacterized protein n=1 Tax=Parasitella parasitica TaxID=35722 RepID=A0A0B7NQ24_9FUNG|nr:hypothetical protein [Parasitella parasitica]